MKLGYIEIDNFQSHEHTEVRLDPGVNVIVGPSDVGKSSILRAINWVLTNRPSGDAFISNWKSDSTQVWLGFDDCAIGRIKEKGFNGYTFNNQNFKGFGLAVPKEISDFLNINEINVQSQFDSPFMLSWSSGERGAFLNKIVDLEITDKTIGNIKSSLLNERRTIVTLEEEIKELEQELEQYNTLDLFESELIKLERNEETLQKLQENKRKLSDAILLYKQHEQTTDDLSHIPELMKDIDNVHGQVKNLDRINQHIFDLNRIINKAKILSKTCENRKETAKFKRSINNVSINIDKIKKHRKNAEKLKHLIFDIHAINDDLENSKELLEENTKKFEKLMPKRCPLCGK